MDKINSICKQIKKLTNVDFEVVEKMIAEQANYCNPFKNGKQERLGVLSKYNSQVVSKIKDLYTLLQSPPEFVKNKQRKINL